MSPLSKTVGTLSPHARAARAASAAAILIAMTPFARVSAADVVPYPSGYRNWVHVKSMVIEEGNPLYASFGGIHHLYANAKALSGYRQGTFPDGSIIVFDLLAAISADHAITEGPRKVVGVMVKNHLKYAKTGGWGFEAFKGNSHTERVVGANAGSSCFACHAAQQSRDYVFSQFRR
jgi:hypothetical protein